MNPTVFELRSYTLHPGRRDELIALFEREFIEAQQDAGMSLPGLFTDMDRPDRFVWLRGFADMAARSGALDRFYTGPVWQRHRHAANATMVDSDDVLLLKGEMPSRQRAGQLFLCVDVTTDDEQAVEALLTARLDGDIVGRWTTDATPNNYPRLPVREGEGRAVWLLRLANQPDMEALAVALSAWSSRLLRLQPISRSALQLDPQAPVHIGRAGDFDFLVGRWSVRNRRLRAGAWREFDAISEAWSHMNGQVSVDEIRFETEGFSGATLRTLDVATRQWSIYWINSRSGTLLPPVQGGGWRGERGEFHGVDVDEAGRPVLVRFVWLRLGTDAARWTQAFSADGGRSWEDNWVMDFTRL